MLAGRSAPSTECWVPSTEYRALDNRRKPRYDPVETDFAFLASSASRDPLPLSRERERKVMEQNR
jgi:hypothetical protein